LPSQYDWKIKKPNFSDLPFFLRSLAGKVVDDIVYGIVNKRSSDGSAQQYNKIATIIKKGHDHQLIGGDENSPQLALKGNYRITQPDPDEAVISIAPIRAQIAVYVERLGYDFFAFSPRADKIIIREWRRYLKGKIGKLFG
tara:strand:+ start:720 stop:1142 length:423 start_codon:yes stop_codon:yes gene_type:complete